MSSFVVPVPAGREPRNERTMVAAWRRNYEQSGPSKTRTHMSAVKEVVRDILDQLPEETSLEEVQYRLYVREKVEHGLEDVAAGRVISQEEAEQRMAKWLCE